MNYSGKERRKYPALRNHVQALLNDGATVKARDPLQLAHKGLDMTVLHGILVCEPTGQELTDALAVLASGDDDRRAFALEVCLSQLDAALAPYPPFRPVRCSTAKRRTTT